MNDLTKREYFAITIMNGMVSSERCNGWVTFDIINESVFSADELLKHLNSTDDPNESTPS